MYDSREWLVLDYFFVLKYPSLFWNSIKNVKFALYTTHTYYIIIRMTSLTHQLEGDDYEAQILSKSIKAGRRTYFFDVKATRGGDYFLTITESRKVSRPDGTPTFDRHKIFLYKEDFAKFTDGLAEVIEFIKAQKPEFFEE